MRDRDIRIEGLENDVRVHLAAIAKVNDRAIDYENVCAALVSILARAEARALPFTRKLLAHMRNSSQCREPTHSAFISRYAAPPSQENSNLYQCLAARANLLR